MILGRALETVAKWVGGGPGLAGGTLRADRVRDQCLRPSTFLMSKEMAVLEGPLQSSGGLRPSPGARAAGEPGCAIVTLSAALRPWQARTMCRIDHVSSLCHADNHANPLLLPGVGI